MSNDLVLSKRWYRVLHPLRIDNKLQACSFSEFASWEAYAAWDVYGHLGLEKFSSLIRMSVPECMITGAKALIGA